MAMPPVRRIGKSCRYPGRLARALLSCIHAGAKRAPIALANESCHAEADKGRCACNSLDAAMSRWICLPMGICLNVLSSSGRDRSTA
jgi:hypothetical protein